MQDEAATSAQPSGVARRPGGGDGLRDIAQLAAALCDAEVGLVILDDGRLVASPDGLAELSALARVLEPVLQAAPADADLLPALDAALQAGGQRLRAAAVVPISADASLPRGWILALDAVPGPARTGAPSAAFEALARQALSQLALPELASLRARHEAIEQRYRRVLGNVTGMVYRTGGDDGWSIEFVSEGSRELLGLSPEELLASDVSAADFVHPDDIETVRNLSRAAVAPDADGRLDARYRLKLRAFAALRGRRPVRLVVLGEGPERDALERLAGELGVADDVSFHGFVANPFAFMARADAFVLSSAWEGLPNALIQARALGVSVVATDCPSGPREILDGGELGDLVAVGDAEAMATALDAALERGPQPARPAWVARYDPIGVAERYLAVLGVDR